METDKGKIADALESLLWPNMSIGNKVIILAAINALREQTSPVKIASVEPNNRKAFELAANALGYVEDYYFFTNTHPNYYDDDRINDMWCIWNACRESMLNNLQNLAESGS